MPCGSLFRQVRRRRVVFDGSRLALAAVEADPMAS